MSEDLKTLREKKRELKLFLADVPGIVGVGAGEDYLIIYLTPTCPNRDLIPDNFLDTPVTIVEVTDIKAL